MPVFAYTALDAGQRVRRSSLIADTAVEARQALRDRRLRILECAPARLRSRGGRGWVGRHRGAAVAQIARDLSLLLRAGVPVVESLGVLTRHRRGRLDDVLRDVRDRVTGGAALADALSRHPRDFDAVVVSAVRMGEATGHLDAALAELSLHLESGRHLRGQVANALTYPLILCCVSIGVTVFLMTKVLPQLLTVLEASGRPLPTSTRIVQGASDVLVRHGGIVALSAAALVAAGVMIARTARGRRVIQGALLDSPVLGALLRKTTVARFAQRMALLLRTGVPFVDAVRTVRGLCRNVILAEELDAVARTVEAGGAIAGAIRHSRVFPPVVVQLVAVGQDTGQLPQMLDRLKEGYEIEVRLAVQRFTAALEPLLIVVMAVGVGFILWACLMPILEATRGLAGS